jgi:hypothetical protein
VLINQVREFAATRLDDMLSALNELKKVGPYPWVVPLHPLSEDVADLRCLVISVFDRSSSLLRLLLLRQSPRSRRALVTGPRFSIALRADRLRSLIVSIFRLSSKPSLLCRYFDPMSHTSRNYI